MCHTIISRRKVDGRKFTPSRAFCRGAGFGGHRQALEHEARVLERAAADKYAHAARLRDELQKRTAATTVKSAVFLGTQIKSTQAMLKRPKTKQHFTTAKYSLPDASLIRPRAKKNRHRACPPVRNCFTRSSQKFPRGAPRRARCRGKCTNQQPQPSSLARAERPAVA